MSKLVLGISAFYHDSAAALVRDGDIVAAAQEERFSRKKHDPRFPVNAINYCLEEAFVDASELDAVVFYDNPLLTLDRVLKNCLTMGPSSLDQFRRSRGWKVGIDGSIALIDIGAGKTIDTDNVRAPVLWFVFDPRGLMYNLTFEGSKFTKLVK